MTGPLLRLRGQRRDGGRAIVEFVFLGVLMLVPLVYLVTTLAQVQAASFSATSAAREAGRAFTTADGDASGAARARVAASVAFADFGFTDNTDLRVSCDGSPCLRPEGRVTTTATIVVRLPLVPDLIAEVVPAQIPVSATHVASVDRFGGR